MAKRVLIVGGGLAGLCCALHLQAHQIGFELHEASDVVGGRVRTDVVDGFRLDRGFQVFLTSYPEARRLLDYAALRLKPFLPGALVRSGGKFHLLADPWRRPTAALGSLFTPIGTFADKLRVARLRSRVLRGTFADCFAGPETTTLKALQDFGFTPGMIDRFFRPFLGGIFLEPELATSSRMLEFVFRMFSSGDAALPSAGMGAIPIQLAARLPSESLFMRSPVMEVGAERIELAHGEIRRGDAVVVATEARSAAWLLPSTKPPEGVGVTCLYFATPHAPVGESILVLNGEGRGLINNLCVPTNVCSAYGPGNQSLISVTCLGASRDEAELKQAVRAELTDWYGAEVKSWRLLKTYTIPYALPRQAAPALSQPERPVRVAPGLYVCGDHVDNASIQGAMVSGRRAAQAVLEDLQ